MKNKVLIIPDIFYSQHSGAIAAREAAKIFIKLNCEVAVFTSEPKNALVADYITYKRTAFKGTAHLLKRNYLIEFQKVLDDFNPTLVFFIGGIINKNVYYFDACKEKNIKTAMFLFVQDFYCSNMHASLKNGPCIKCLKGSFIHSFFNNCTEKTAWYKRYFYLSNVAISRAMLKSRLINCDFILSSTEEQLGFLEDFGIERAKLINCPLFFDTNRVKKYEPKMGDYFVVSGQKRIEKGLHLLPDILKYTNGKIKIKIPFYSKNEAQNAIKEYNLKQYIDSGIIEIFEDMTWTNGGDELVANSRGVIIPTIWPTTTEFVLIEALGYKKPVFSFNLGIHKEKIINYENGFKVNLFDFEQFGKFLLEINFDDILYKKISKGAYELYFEFTNEELIKNQMKNMLIN